MIPILSIVVAIWGFINLMKMEWNLGRGRYVSGLPAIGMSCLTFLYPAVAFGLPKLLKGEDEGTVQIIAVGLLLILTVVIAVIGFMTKPEEE